ncbi:uncharacterized protein LOC110875597 [Helianthus annuus]|uniref:uncharacterized protein LOC110875597 n=1 Tax=Helianthus annuus TaxID=4232 RepID=UPI000B8F223D|nr:uncharacterized protein LOC110875597 [Helianthus annuus]
MVFKVDFEKAYDTISWECLLKNLKLMGFPNRWRRWIDVCLKSGRASVLVNGSPTEEFPLGRGLRQGDPLSPFLFIIALEILDIFMKKAVEGNLFRGITFSNGGPTISHLCYADDVVFMGEWSKLNLKNLNQILRVLFLVTGLKVNMKKSRLYGVGVSEDKVERMVLDTLEGIRRSFVWGSKGGKKKIKWVSWNCITKPKDRGGLGLGDLQSLNWALTAKWFWRFKNNDDALWVKVVQAIHGSDFNNDLVPVNNQVNGIWKDIVSVNKNCISMGMDIRESLLFKDNKWIWAGYKEDLFTVAEFMDKIMKKKNDGPNDMAFRWNNWLPPKVNLFCWRAFMGKIPSKVGLVRRGVQIGDLACSSCGLEEEDSDHILFSCMWAKAIWWNVWNWLKLNGPDPSSIGAKAIHAVKSLNGSNQWKRLI